jgi:TRAP-type C4-dicarboxylate transport system permease small subunit
MRANEPRSVMVSETYQKIISPLRFIALASIALLGVSTAADVIKRLSTGWPIGGVMQLSECLMVVMVFLGIAYAQANRRHIRVTIALSRMKPRKVVILDILSCAIQITVLIFLARKTLEEGIWSCSILEYRVGDIRLPIYWARMLIPIGTIALIGQLLIDIWIDIDRLRGRAPLDLPDVRAIQEIV